MNIIAIRMFKAEFGDIMDVCNLLKKISARTIITEEINPYQHYHLMIWTEKTLAQVKKYLYNHKIRGSKIRNRNNINVQPVKNDKAYERYIKKDYTIGFDTAYGWLENQSDYLYDFDKTDLPASELATCIANTIDPNIKRDYQVLSN